MSCITKARQRQIFTNIITIVITVPLLTVLLFFVLAHLGQYPLHVTQAHFFVGLILLREMMLLNVCVLLYGRHYQIGFYCRHHHHCNQHRHHPCFLLHHRSLHVVQANIPRLGICTKIEVRLPELWPTNSIHRLISGLLYTAPHLHTHRDKDLLTEKNTVSKRH